MHLSRNRDQPGAAQLAKDTMQFPSIAQQAYLYLRVLYLYICYTCVSLRSPANISLTSAVDRGYYKATLHTPDTHDLKETFNLVLMFLAACLHGYGKPLSVLNALYLFIDHSGNSKLEGEQKAMSLLFGLSSSIG